MGVESLINKLVGVSPSELGNQASQKDRERIFAKAEQSIRIVSPTALDIEPLKKAVAKGIKVEIAIASGSGELALPGAHIYKMPVSGLVNPFAVIDGKHAILQEPTTREHYTVLNFKNIQRWNRVFEDSIRTAG